VEQPSVQRTTVRPYPSAVPPGVKDVFVWLTETPVPSDLLFVVCYTNALTYLLTYLSKPMKDTRIAETHKADTMRKHN